jgi:hypothetical protein
MASLRPIRHHDVCKHEIGLVVARRIERRVQLPVRVETNDDDSRRALATRADHRSEI